MHAQENWGEEQNAWLVELSYGTAIAASIAFTALLLFIFRVPVLRALTWLLGPLITPLAYTLSWMKLLILVTPLREPLRRYVYTPRHLQEA